MKIDLNSIAPEEFESYYQLWHSDPSSVDGHWQKFFEGFELGIKNFEQCKASETAEEFTVIKLIDDYRKRGHLFTKTNPVRVRRQYSPTLALENYGLDDTMLKKSFNAGKEIGIGKATLNDIIAHLKQTYCESIGAEFKFIRNVEIDNWLTHKMEAVKNTPSYTKPEKHLIISKLREAVYFEKFIHKRYPGQKRFSLEGAESIIPALEIVINEGAEMGTEEFIIGMAHRGRLNVLANILHKPLESIFSEFNKFEYEQHELLGDVKYHFGFSQHRDTLSGRKVKLTLAPNPSHLEAVDPVVQGIARARIDLKYRGDEDKITPILIHGDASIAGQGVVYEVLQMSELKGYKTGGTIHLVINNQIGFTTNYLDARTSIYCTDIAKVVQAPVFHVNGDDVEAVAYTIQMAMAFRKQFNKDVFIDLLCYRKYGHNESDEPRFTQPILYKTIEKHTDPYTIYKNRLIEDGVFVDDELKKEEEDHNEYLEQAFNAAKEIEKVSILSFLSETWKDIRKSHSDDFIHSPSTGVKAKVLEKIVRRLTHVPEDVTIFNKIKRLQNDRHEQYFFRNAIDWGMAELMAYGTLVNENFSVRLSGQDVERGTFSHRHAVLTVEDSEEKYVPLDTIHSEKGRFNIFNSPLSEFGILGFEYGFALSSPNTLTIWEAQFGDFINSAQVVVDQFIASAEEKWNAMNGLVLLLPHGFEGQGPEHSSARLERFLSLSAENNMQVVVPSTPANFFHLLRRQLHRDFRKPLIVFAPKSLLRHPKCVSAKEVFINGKFEEVIDDDISNTAPIKKVAFCSGKIWYELIEEREKKGYDDIAIIRIEQLYPFPAKQIRSVTKKYSNAEEWLWVQEEPGNMGAWSFFSRHFRSREIRMIARPDSGAPATGSGHLHKIRQQKIIEKTFSVCKCDRVKEECRMICAENDY
ncbi:MAG: 2-oxoglutarate dehydrogenase E1 component [Bacteroidales bacterium]|nr:2-oxoglutarate dehydrogenase E1 component [Bacteroidales bacterium]